jgi:hypothetical protein
MYTTEREKTRILVYKDGEKVWEREPLRSSKRAKRPNARGTYKATVTFTDLQDCLSLVENLCRYREDVHGSALLQRRQGGETSTLILKFYFIFLWATV